MEGQGRSRVYKTEALILKRRKLGEADAILTIYTPRFGKYDVIAKGIRRPKSRMGGHLDLLCRSSLLLAHGSSLDIVTQAQTLEPYRALRDNLEALSSGIYAAELVLSMTGERQEDFPLYQLLCETLGRLAGPRRQAALRYFEVRALSELGYEPQVWQCAGCGNPLQEGDTFISGVHGGIVCRECLRGGHSARPISASGVKVLRALLSLSWQEAARIRLDQSLEEELASRLRDYLRALLERELRSVEFLDQVARPAPATGVADRRPLTAC